MAGSRPRCCPVGSSPLWVHYNRPPLMMRCCKRLCPWAAAAPVVWSYLAMLAGSCRWPGRGWPALHGGWPWLAAPPSRYLRSENVARTHEGGQASSSLAVSTRWISAAKLLQSDLATLA
ncbi:hypothetical protein B296_00006138 [Ensete ventricosum]|uniref:Uncharacterized protein n=1 Tax=Ensete ventricosum TaxID=4639 RepID=A0A427ASF5_ENSVE|nr:hypothetical protein B296_00006138 [Ensete ventricosum]